MKAQEFVKQHYPNAISYCMIDNRRGRNSYVIIKGNFGLEIFPNEGANTASKAWTNARKEIEKLQSNGASKQSMPKEQNGD